MEATYIDVNELPSSTEDEDFYEVSDSELFLEEEREWNFSKKE